MTRIITLVVLGLLCTLNTQAQDSQSPLKAGVTLGVNKTNLIYTSTDNPTVVQWEPRNTLALGAVGKFQINNNWAVQSGVILTERGTTFRPLIDTDTRIWTAEIPINIRYEVSLSSLVNLDDANGIRTYGFAGMYLGYGLLSGVAENKNWQKSAFGELYERNDLGLAAGAGISLDINEFSGDLQIKYSIGLKDVISDESLNGYTTNTRVSLVYYLFR